MNHERGLEHRVTAVFDGEAPSRGPDDLLEDVFAVTGSTRPRPRWWARLTEKPMRYDAVLVSGSPTVRAAGLVATTLLLLVAMAGLAVAGAQLLGGGRTYVVAPDGSGDFETISEAVAATVDGDIVAVRPGTYKERFTIRNDITVRGDGRREDVVIVPPESDFRVVLDPDTASQVAMPAGIDLQLADATIESLELHAAVPMVALVVNGGSVDLDDVAISTNDSGGESRELSLLVSGGATTRVSDADLRQGVQSFEASSLVVERSSLTAVIDAAGPGRIEVYDSRFTSDAELHASEHATGALARNEFGGATISVLTASELEIRDNVFSGSSRTAITLANDGTRASIIDNDIRGSRAGIAIGPGTSATVSGNTVCGNEVNMLTSSEASADIHDNVISEDCSGE